MAKTRFESKRHGKCRAQHETCDNMGPWGWAKSWGLRCSSGEDGKPTTCYVASGKTYKTKSACLKERISRDEDRDWLCLRPKRKQRRRRSK